MRLIDLDSLPHPYRPVRLTSWFDGYIVEQDEAATRYLVLRDRSGEKHSLLDSCLAVFRDTVPVTLLKSEQPVAGVRVFGHDNAGEFPSGHG